MSTEDIQDIVLVVINIMFGIQISLLYASIALYRETKRANKEGEDA